MQLLAQLTETLSVSDADDHSNVNRQKSKVSWYPLYYEYCVMYAFLVYIRAPKIKGRGC